MEIKSITNENIDALINMALKLWPGSPYAQEHKFYTGLLKSQTGTCLLLLDQEIYIGFIHIALRHDPVEGTHTSPVGYVEGIYIEPAFRKQGYGQQLLDAGAQWCKSKGCLEYASDVELDNLASLEFHKKSGFKLINKIACFAKRI